MGRHSIRLRVALVALVSLMGGLLLINSSSKWEFIHQRKILNKMAETGESPSQQNHIDKTWDPNKPQFVLIVGYFRVSSSFIGQLLNQNDRVFYLFEPVDGIYNDMYGTQPRYSVATDIDFYPNTTARVMPEWEKAFVQASLSTIGTCNFSEATTGMLTTEYLFMWADQMKKTEPYASCLEEEGIHDGYQSCRGHISHNCPHRFTPDSKACADKIHLAATGRSYNQNFKDHLACQLKYRALLNEKCLHLLQDACLASPIRAAKTVRMSMETAGRLMMELHSNVKIIHLIRDPKSVVVSRFKFDGSVHGIESNHVTEARMYCRKVLKDVEERRRLERLFPSTRFLQIFTDDFVHKTQRGTEELYKYLGEPMPESVAEFVLQETRVKQWNSGVLHRDYRPKWHGQISSETALIIDQECIDMYEALKPPWRNHYAL